MQTNFASDLRNILKCVFLMNSSQMMEEDDGSKDPSSTCTDQPADQPNDDAVETTGDVHERQEPLPEYEDVEETALAHDRGTNFVFALCLSHAAQSERLNVEL